LVTSSFASLIEIETSFPREVTRLLFSDDNYLLRGATFRIVKNKETLKGLAFSLPAVVVCFVLLIWMLSTLRAVSRHKASQKTALPHAQMTSTRAIS
jgi:hypothetical protein